MLLPTSHRLPSPPDTTSATPTDCPRSPPELVHCLRHSSAILALVVSPLHETIYAGSQDGEILAWSLSTYRLLRQVQAHKRSLLSLVLSPDSSLLISSAGDAVVNIWSPHTFERLHEIYGLYDVGDIFCTAYSSLLRTLYLGAQNSSIQWLSLDDPRAKVGPDSPRHPDRRSHRFFDSKASNGSTSPRKHDERQRLIPPPLHVLEIDAQSVCTFAHHGYVYCMLLAKGPTVEMDAQDEVLISGGGDGTIKVWALNRQSDSASFSGPSGRLEELMTLGTDNAQSVLSLAIDGSFLYAGKLDAVVELWDLDTAQRLRVIKAHGDNIMSLQMGWGYLWTASTGGWACFYSIAHYGVYRNASGRASQRYQCLSRWKAHDAKILASAITNFKDDRYYITGANDNTISIWSFTDIPCTDAPDIGPEEGRDVLLTTLADFVSYKTVSTHSHFAEDCRKGATFLGSLFKRLGGDVEMLSTEKAHNPVVYATFSSKKASSSRRKRILFYGHYDVVAADEQSGKWTTDPFKMTGLDGYLYGRGVSDNKGPVLAALYAVTDLVQAKTLNNDVLFLIEGEEEFGSRGFEEAVRRNRGLIGEVDYILLANSYWLDDQVPCLTYGLRGLLLATVSVEAPRPDTHSGIDGSFLVDEPLSDLTRILSQLKGARNRIQIPAFYDGIPPLGPEEEARYDEIVQTLARHDGRQETDEALKRSLMARWRQPNLTIHRYNVSGPDGSRISSQASANISLRLVPGQEIDAVTTNLTDFLNQEFASLQSGNRLRIDVVNKAEPWLGDPNNAIFHTLEQAIVEAWPDRFSGAASRPQRPLYIREGGSIPAIRFLEKEFGAPAAHLPVGCASDAAHLDNERMAIVNLLKAGEIFGKLFDRL